MFCILPYSRQAPTIVEEVLDEEEAPACTFDDDADASIERCWADGDANVLAKNATVDALLLSAGDWTSQPLVLGFAGVALVAVVAVLGLLMRKGKKNAGSTTST